MEIRRREISCRIEDGIATMRIDRPEALNALSRSIVDDMDEILEALKESREAKVLLIHNEGNFAAGADIGGMAKCTPEEAGKFAFSPTFNKLEALKIPTIAAIEGYALGGGLELALACDMRIAAESAKMGFPEITLGIMPGAGGTVRAARLVGPAKAKELIFMGKTLGAQDARKIGLVNAVAAQDEFEDMIRKWTHRLAKAAPVALQVAKKTIDDAAKESDSIKGIEIESRNWAGLFETEDQKEGMTAFLEKRKPVFVGK